MDILSFPPLKLQSEVKILRVYFRDKERDVLSFTRRIVNTWIGYHIFELAFQTSQPMKEQATGTHVQLIAT